MLTTRITQFVSLSALVLALGAAGLPGPQPAAPPTLQSVASPVDGARVIQGRVLAHSSWYRTVDLRGGEMTVLFLRGDGDTDLDLYLYDELGNLVIVSDGPTDEELIWVSPNQTGRFIIRVHNFGSVYNDFSLTII